MKNDFELDTNGDFKKSPIFTLFDEECGKDKELSLLARTEYKGQLYYALAPLDDIESYVILSVKEDGEDIIFESVEDDELFEELVNIFDDLLDEEMDYDA